MVAVGKSVGGYTLTTALGAGTIGETFAATSSKGEVALKLIHGRLSLMDRTEPFWKAIQQLAPLAHPYMLVPTASRWTSSGRFMVRMEHASGSDLRKVLETHGHLSARQTLRIIGQICLALEAAHAKGVVHGAIKPTNIILVPSGDNIAARLTDFATHLLIGDNSTDRPAAYLAPEQFSGPPGIRSDVYALAVLLVETLTGAPPTTGSYEEIAQRHENGESVEIPGETIPSLVPVLKQALAIDPEGRLEDVASFREALEKWAATSPVELAEDGPILFSKEESGSGVVQDMGDDIGPNEDTVREVVFSEDIVRVPIDDLSQAFADEYQEPETVPTNEDKQSTEDETTPAKARSMEERELATLAEQASAPLRKSEADGEAAPKPSNGEEDKPAAEAVASSEDGEEVELPIERTVKAFVSTISPSVPADDGKNGESLELAFDQFVSEAKAVGTALPKPIIDDQALAALAKAPVAEPEPKPEPEPEPKPAPLPAPVAVPLTPAPPAPAKSPMPMLIGGVILGGIVVFGGMKLMQKPVTTTAPPAQTDVVAPTPAAVDSAAVAKPIASPDVRAASADIAVVTPTTADAAAPTAASADAASTTAATAADAQVAVDAAPAVAKKVKPKKRSRKKRVKRARAKKRTPRAKKASKKRAPKKAKKPKKKSGDWVDPFSQ